MSTETILALACLAVGFASGWAIESARWSKDVESIKLEAATLRANQGRIQYEKLVAAQDALAAARRDSVDLRADAERVRRAYEDRLRRAEASAGGTVGAAPAGCTQLLVRCTDLLARGGSLA